METELCIVSRVDCLLTIRTEDVAEIQKENIFIIYILLLNKAKLP